ncbi:MAG: SDR family NAD(P)-dependent oxidoreductase [Actinomycetota bacterium]
MVITGASRGIGAQMADRFARAGAKLTLVARSVDALEAVAAKVDGNAVPADLTDRAAVDALVPRVEDEFGPIDVLVNNAGLEGGRHFHLTDVGLARDIATLNFESPVVLTRAVIDGMLTRNRGHIVFVSSLAGTAGFPGLAVYGGTKAGITNFSAALRMELSDTAIGTTVVAPGPVDTQMWDNLEEEDALAPMLKRLRRLQLIPRVSPERIAELTVAAVEKEKAYVGLPRRLAVNHVLRNLPTRVSSLALAGVPLGPKGGGD